ncbi:Ig-like domain-containing protein [Deinococcus sp. YIM 77859]|uniref:Ig-like domain-containing protein n=1 Tax=Deinococcus sp. YIM 77859 TaxID=1540221 RepID=UPI00068F8AED|nr:Ig-like domain-containing protein [Deinococcus sp. YIM 77859]
MPHHTPLFGLCLALTLGLVACGTAPREETSSELTLTPATTATYRYDGYNLSLAVGERVSGTYTAGATWTSSHPAVASVVSSTDGRFMVTGVSAGTAYVRGSSGGRSAELKVTVFAGTAPAPAVTAVTLSAKSLSLTAGSSQTVTATVQGSGSVSQAVTWSSSHSGIARVDSVGRVTGVAAGSAIITATSVQDTSQKASLSVTVTPPAAPPTPTPTADAFNITVIFPANSMLTAEQQAAFTAAASRWSRVIAAGLPDVANVRLSTGQTVTVDDVAIVASGVTIDGPGQVLGQAGPRQVRSGTSLPLWGEMQFDAADLASMEANGSLQGVILHEMGHVLGIGTLWDEFLNANASSCVSATKVQYSGTNGLREYRNLGGQAAGVPVEDGYGTGTKCGHWKESVFQSELMTGFAQRGTMPLSRMTLGALADLGYSVNYGAADTYSIPQTAAQEGGMEIRERLITPEGITDPTH